MGSRKQDLIASKKVKKEKPVRLGPPRFEQGQWVTWGGTQAIVIAVDRRNNSYDLMAISGVVHGIREDEIT